jgi:hypothetical protein
VVIVFIVLIAAISCAMGWFCAKRKRHQNLRKRALVGPEDGVRCILVLERFMS